MDAPEGIEFTLIEPVLVLVGTGPGPGPPCSIWTTKTETGWIPDIPGTASGQRFEEASPETNVTEMPDPSSGSVYVASSPGRRIPSHTSSPFLAMDTFAAWAVQIEPLHSPQSGSVAAETAYPDARGARSRLISPKRRVAWRGSDE
ncbi:MAG: hypothetical protein A4E38_01063 [Methanoregulaceae archaeon PtaB.Bin108]|nr:MAG: hypothetical protein A4E38_01063 [Methanoregulaceae archaeon PtaB.Bin108]